MALTARIGEKGIRHSDPNSLVHRRHVEQAPRRRVIDRVIVDVNRDDAVKLNALGDQWEKRWDGWQGDTFLVEQKTYVLTTAKKVRTKLKRCSGKEFTAAAAGINRITWYWSERSDKGVVRKVKRKVEKNRLGRLCDRHTVTFSPPAMRLIQKLNLSQRDAAALMKNLQEKNVQFFAEKVGRRLVLTSGHSDSGILHFDILSSRINSKNNLCGDKSLPSLSNESWTIGAWRQRELGCKLSETKTKWLQDNLRRFAERHGDRQSILLQLHEKLDRDFEEWVEKNGYSKLWQESKSEYRAWVGKTEPAKEQWALERASGKNAWQLAERAAMCALRICLPPSVYTLVRGTMTAAQIVSDLLEGDRNPQATGLLLQSVVCAGRELLKSNKSQRIRQRLIPQLPRL